MKKSILSSLFVLFSVILFAQDAERIEFNVDDAVNGKYHTYPMGDKGLLLMYEPKGKAKLKDHGLQLKKFNTDFKEIGKSTFTPPKGFVFTDVVSDENNVYILYSPKSATFKKYALIKIDKNTLKTTQYNGEHPKHLDYDNIQVLNGVVYLGMTAGPNPNTAMAIACLSMPLCFIPYLLYNPKYYTMVMAVDFNKKVPQRKDYELGGGKGITIGFYDITKNDSLDRLDLFLYMQGKKISRDMVREINHGKLEKEKIVKFSSGKEIQSGKAFSVSANQKVMIGEYKNKSKDRKERKANAKQAPGGIFIGSMEDGKQTFMKLVPFSSFKNFTISIPKTEKQEKKISAKRKAAQDKYLQNIISFTFHDILIREDEILVFAEPYYPTYHTETRVVVNANGTTSTQTVQVFDGYKYIGALVMAFDMEGNMKWENGFKITDGPLSFSRAKKFDFYELEDEGIKVVYNNGGAIYSKVIYNDKVDSEVSLMKVETKTKDKKVKHLVSRTGEISGTEFWYDNYYLAFGIQKITSEAKAKERAKDEKKNRTIFYINKLEIEN